MSVTGLGGSANQINIKRHRCSNHSEAARIQERQADLHKPY
ncbi:hypothetical protein [Kovacikia minuta]|nr:hypothetical protein [Kovacikia minuta]